MRYSQMDLFIPAVFELALKEIRANNDLPLVDEVDILLEEGIVHNRRLQRLAELHDEQGDLDREPPEPRMFIRRPRPRPVAQPSNAVSAGAAAEPVASISAQGG